MEGENFNSKKTFECSVPFSEIGPAKLTNHGACTN